MKVKLIIWDLDDTLWQGTLAEGDDVQLHPYRAGVLRQLNQNGVVSAVCSKNDPDAAKMKLEHFGLWSEIVFPRIGFVPKGQAVKEIIEDMQLRPVDVLFIDDNHHNLEEVRHVLPEIKTLNASEANCDAVLAELLIAHSGVHKSRVGEYRMLEEKLRDRSSVSQSNEEFLRSCGIHVVLIPGMDNLDFAARIEEVINRTNQMNFLKTRIEADTVPEFIADRIRYEHFSVVVWDRYGHYGLVGFAAIKQATRKLVHFAFSCRIMHMGIEQHVLAKLKKHEPRLDLTDLPVEPKIGDWIQSEEWTNPAIRSYVLNKESVRSTEDIAIRVMVSCQSGAIAHFSGLSSITDFDNYPRQFYLRQMLDDSYLKDTYAPYLVYGALVDYVNFHWPQNVVGKLDTGLYEQCAQKLCDFVVERGSRMLVLLPPEVEKEDYYRPADGLTRKRVRAFNEIWKRLAESRPELTLLPILELVESGDLLDVRHFMVGMLKKLGERTAKWYAEHRDGVAPVPASSHVQGSTTQI